MPRLKYLLAETVPLEIYLPELVQKKIKKNISGGCNYSRRFFQTHACLLLGLWHLLSTFESQSEMAKLMEKRKQDSTLSFVELLQFVLT